MDSFKQFLNSNKNASESVEPNSSKWMAGLKWAIQLFTASEVSDPCHMLTTFQCNGEEETNKVNRLIQSFKSQEFIDNLQERYETHLEEGGEESEEEFKDKVIMYTANMFVLLMLLARTKSGE